MGFIRVAGCYLRVERGRVQRAGEAKKSEAERTTQCAVGLAHFPRSSCRDADAVRESGIAESAADDVWTLCPLDAAALLSLDARERRPHRLVELRVGPRLAVD